MDEIIERLERLEALLTMQKEVLSLGEAARYLDMSDDRLRRLARERSVPHYKQGRKLYFKRSELDDWRCSSPVPTIERTTAEAVTARLIANLTR
jgi:excisionase family DNA binding protein